MTQTTSSLCLESTAKLLVLDETIGPVYRPIKELALGDEILVVADGRMCFRHLVGIEDTDSPSEILRVLESSLAANVPNNTLFLDVRHSVSLPTVGSPLKFLSKGDLPPSDETPKEWFQLRIDGAERIITNNIAVAIGPPSQVPASYRPVAPESLVQIVPLPGTRVGSELPATGTVIVQNKPVSVSVATEASVPSDDPQVDVPVKAISGSVALNVSEKTYDRGRMTLQFVLPARTTTLRLTSNWKQPPGDSRKLGVAILAIQIGTTDLPLDHPSLVRGFHRAETGEGQTWRWTDGDAMLILQPKPFSQSLSIVITDWHNMLCEK